MELPRFQQLRASMESFGVELLNVNLAFWLPEKSPPDKNLLLSGAAIALMYSARRTHSAYAELSTSSKAILIVLVGALAVSFGACLLAPKLRSDRADYLANASKLFRLTGLGLLISAGLISLNHMYPWADKLSFAFGFISYPAAILYSLALPAALGSLIIIAGLSFYQKNFRSTLSSTGDRARVAAWGLYYVSAVFFLNFALFDFGQ